MRIFKLRNNLKAVRQSRNLSLFVLAKLVGTSEYIISAIETGVYHCSVHLAARLCAALDVRFEDLFWFELEDLYAMGLAKEGRDFLTVGQEDDPEELL